MCNARKRGNGEAVWERVNEWVEGRVLGRALKVLVSKAECVIHLESVCVRVCTYMFFGSGFCYRPCGCVCVCTRWSHSGLISSTSSGPPSIFRRCFTLCFREPHSLILLKPDCEWRLGSTRAAIKGWKEGSAKKKKESGKCSTPPGSVYRLQSNGWQVKRV